MELSFLVILSTFLCSSFTGRDSSLTSLYILGEFHCTICCLSAKPLLWLACGRLLQCAKWPIGMIVARYA